MGIVCELKDHELFQQLFQQRASQGYKDDLQFACCVFLDPWGSFQNGNMDQILVWCMKTIANNQWRHRVLPSADEWYPVAMSFANEEDCAMFKLTWM